MITSVDHEYEQIGHEKEGRENWRGFVSAPLSDPIYAAFVLDALLILLFSVFALTLDLISTRTCINRPTGGHVTNRRHSEQVEH